MKSRMLMSLLVIALAAALIGGATAAWFTDAAQPEEVTFAAGTLMIDVDNLELSSASRDDLVLDRLNPGDSWTWEFNVYNVGTKSANWLLYMCWQDIIGLENEDLPEGQVELLAAREGFGTNGLSEVVEWEISVDGAVVFQGTLPQEGPLVIDDLTPFDALGEDGALRSQTVTVTATLPGEATDNKYQGSKMNIAFGVKAWQTTNDAPKPTVTKEDDCPFYQQPEPPTLPEFAGYEPAVETILSKNLATGKYHFDVSGTITAKDENGDVFDLDGQKSVNVAVEYMYPYPWYGWWYTGSSTYTTTVTFVDGVASLSASWDGTDYYILGAYVTKTTVTVTD